MSQTAEAKAHNVELKNRNEIKVSGIVSVDSFDEERITATCIDGIMILIEGSGLSVKEVNLEFGFIEAAGDVSGFFYESKTKSSVGFLKGFFSRP